MRRALIACGGTGGHLAPGIALAEELVTRGWICKLLISGKQVDSRLVQKYTQFEYEAIPGRGLSFRPVPLMQFLWLLLKGYRRCIRIIRSSHPDVVIGFGGFISASALLAGARNGIPVAIHEANQVPGRVTRMASRYASRVYLPEGVELEGVDRGRIRHVGMPLRSEFTRLPKAEAKRALGFDPEKKLLFVFGGSQGAQSFNQWARESLDKLVENEIQLLCLTGMSDPVGVEKSCGTEKAQSVKSLFLNFSDDMSTLLSAADLAVSRAGAGSIAELIRCRVPTILIPYPHAADDHQDFNAKRFVDQGGGALCRQEEIETLLDTVVEWMSNDSRLEKVEELLGNGDQKDARKTLADDIERLASSKNKGPKESLTVA